MPFCTNCGSRVDANASFCSNCGTAQPRPTAQFSDFLEGISNRTASILCYIPVFGVIPAIIFLASQRFRRNMWVRFDAFQSLYLFVAWLILSSAIPNLISGVPGWGLFGLIKLVVILCWIYLLVKAAQNQQVRLPILGDLAARSAFEQL
ncbi:MAG TPA: zinc-ribbon domain-containing protein [Bryobacteraceae bacterium]|nr:zinc-ribbon domain-containing protein [Bryobacteraceae bacterium]